MHTIVVISDTHGRTEGLNELRPLFAENDYIVHLGDGAADMRAVCEEYPEKTYVCQGNCDFYSALDEWVLEVERVRILICHGHRYGVKSSLSALAAAAKRHGCDAAFYGHTHRPLIIEENGILLVNPGSLRLPAGRGGSYAYVIVAKDKIMPVIVEERAYSGREK